MYRTLAVMDTGDRQRLEAHRHILMQKMPSDFDWDVIVDAVQAPGFSTPMDIVPTVIKNSKMYHFRSERFMVAKELLCAQGVPVLSTDPSLRAHIQEPLLTLCDDFPKKAKSMLGNAMCVPQVGAVMAAALLNAF